MELSCGANTADFMLNGVIPGWTDGIPLIKQGGRIHLYIPPSLGYGNRAVESIPANSILLFDVTLDTVYKKMYADVKLPLFKLFSWYMKLFPYSTFLK